MKDESKPETGERVQKVLAQMGFGSRRSIEKAITDGEIRINGVLATLGQRVSRDDTVEMQGRKISLSNASAHRTRVLLYNKPEGEICSRKDPEGRRSVFDRLPKLKGDRWISVGRLDFNTSGLLLFTNDGDLAHGLMHPSSTIDREYLVRVQGDVNEAMLDRLKEGIMLDDGVAKFTDIVESENQGHGGHNRWFYCVVMEGKNREVRRLWESQGVTISRLKRVRFGNVFIPSHVRTGQWLELTDKEVKSLSVTAGIDQSRKKHHKPSPKELAEQQRHINKLRKGRSKRPRT